MTLLGRAWALIFVAGSSNIINKMVEKYPEDDVAAFFSWKSKVADNETGARGVMTAAHLSRRLSVSTILSAEPTERGRGDPRQRMPPNREVELISKWRDVDLADVELQETRRLYATKMAEFDSRWRKLEAGQSEVKQNLIKFNNFVREKQGKVEGGLERMALEQEHQQARDKELAGLRQEVTTLEAAKTVLGRNVKRRAVFSDYLGQVVGLQPETYPSIRALMERCQALVGTR